MFPAEGRGDLKDAPFEVDADDGFLCRPCEDEEIVQDDLGQAHQVPRGLPSPKAPSKDAIRKHNLTHWPYAPWCPWCVMARRNAEPHFQCKDDQGRLLPLLVLDYCFVKGEADAELVTLLVGKLYPFRKTFACVVDAKGVDTYAVARMAEFIRTSGLSKFVYKSDQESSIKAVMIEALMSIMNEAIRRTGTSGEFVPVPENSAVGASASNGRAERAVQAVEDLVRTLKAALESHLNWKMPVVHPVFRWLVEHAADIMNKWL